MTFYDLHGQPIAYTDDDEHIYLFSVWSTTPFLGVETT